MTGSYVRGDATDSSDLDVFCIFDTIDETVLTSVAFCVNNTSIPYEQLPINTKAMSIEEYKHTYFENWSEAAVVELNSVLLYGHALVTIPNLQQINNKGNVFYCLRVLSVYSTESTLKLF